MRGGWGVRVERVRVGGERLKNSGESQIPWKVAVSRPKTPVSIVVWSVHVRWRPLATLSSRLYHC